MIATDEETVSVKEFAEIMGWAPSTVIRAIQQGRVKTLAQRAPGLRKVSAHRIPRSEIERLKREDSEH